MDNRSQQEVCGYSLNLDTWGENHDTECQLESAEEGVKTNSEGQDIWHCPHSSVNSHDRCEFHLHPDDSSDAVNRQERFTEIVKNDKYPNNCQFVGAKFTELELQSCEAGSDTSIDLRHAEITRAKIDGTIDTTIDASGAIFGSQVENDSKSTCLDVGATVEGSIHFSHSLFIGQVEIRGANIKGCTSLDHSSISGDLNLSSSLFEHQVDIHNSRIGGGLSVFDSTLDSKLKLDGLILESDCTFWGSTFNGVVDLSGFQGQGSEIRGTTEFHESVFKQRVHLDNVRFRGDVVSAGFEPTRFRGPFSFAGAHFSNEVNFEDTVFEELFDGIYSHFENKADFSKNRFNNDVRLEGASFRADSDFSNSKLLGAVEFNMVDVYGTCSFENSEFMQKVNFWDSSFRKKANFTNCVFNSESKFGHSVMLPYSPFFRGVDFSGAVFTDSPLFIHAYNLSGESCDATTPLLMDSDWVFSEASFRDGLNIPELRTLGGPDFSNAYLEDSNFRNADLAECGFEGANLTRSVLYGADLRNAELYGTLLADVRISETTDFGIRGRSSWLPLVSPDVEVVYDPRTRPEYETNNNHISNYGRAATVYSEIESVARTNAMPELAGTAYAWRKDMQRHGYRHDNGEKHAVDYMSWLRSTIVNIIVRYGESPYRVALCGGFIIGFCAFLYHHLNLLVGVGENALKEPTGIDALYFSTLTFTTLGLGDYRPVNDVGRWLAILETSAGVILLALLVFVFGRRATR